MTKQFEPPGLPAQRRGITPGMVGRYPDFDVLEQAENWDKVTRELVLDRVARVPEIRFFDVREAATLGALCDQLSGQVGEEPKIPVLNYVDEKLFEGNLDGYRYFDMPDDRDTWRVVARGLDEEARKLGTESFALLSDEQQRTLCHRFARAELYGNEINDTLVVHPGGQLVNGLVVFDRQGVDGVVEGTALGVGVLSISFGLGRPLLRYKRGETEWSIRLLPIGGYVRLLGELPDDEIAADRKRASFSDRPPLQRLLIILGGPLANILLAVPLFFLIYARHGTALASETKRSSMSPMKLA